MNTLATARTQVSAAVRRWLCTGLLVLLTVTPAPASPAARQHAQGETVSPALASNGSGGGCG